MAGQIIDRARAGKILVVESAGEREALAVFRAMNYADRARMLKLGTAIVAGAVSDEALRNIAQQGPASVRRVIDGLAPTAVLS